VTEYCTVIGMHSTVCGDKLLYGHVPDPFPQCGIGSGHMRLDPTITKTTSLFILPPPGTSACHPCHRPSGDHSH